MHEQNWANLKRNQQLSAEYLHQYEYRSDVNNVNVLLYQNVFASTHQGNT